MINLSVALSGKGKYFEEEKEDLNSALPYFTEAIQTDSTNEESHLAYGGCESEVGPICRSYSLVYKFTQLRPNDPAAWDGLEWVYNLNGETEKAAECRAKSDALKQK
jgi:tetratricopeptide (TPR) repeat protein